MDGTDRTIAFLYDRHATADPEFARLRTQECVEYAGARGWDVRGKWLDLGDDALGITGRRPEFDGLLQAIETTPPDVPCVVLLHTWTRLSHSRATRSAMIHRILDAGARVETYDSATDAVFATEGHGRG